MADSDAVRWEDDLAAEVLRHMRENVTVGERRRLVPQIYVDELMAEIGCVPADPTPELARAEVDRRLPWRLFRDLFQPSKQTSSEYARIRAELRAKKIVENWRSKFRRYGEVNLISFGDGPWYAFHALVDLGKRMRSLDPYLPEVRNPEFFLETIIRGATKRDVDGLIKHAHPRLRLLHHRTKYHEKRLRQGLAEVDEQQCAEDASRMAVESVERAVGFLDRVAYDEAGGRAIEDQGYEEILDEDLVDALESIVSRRPFTPTDLDTWQLWRAADFRGCDIEWLRLRGLTGNTGPQRLVSLCSRLRNFLDPGFLSR